MWTGLSWFHLIQPRETFQPQNPLWGEQVTSPTFHKMDLASISNKRCLFKLSVLKSIEGDWYFTFLETKSTLSEWNA